MISVPPQKMTVQQLESRVRFHESTAEMFARVGEERMAAEFRELAATYRRELGRRGNEDSAVLVSLRSPDGDDAPL